MREIVGRLLIGAGASVIAWFLLTALFSGGVASAFWINAIWSAILIIAADLIAVGIWIID